MIDELAHKRIDGIEVTLTKQLEHIEKLEGAISEHTASLQENTRLTQEIATNTGELVELFKGAKMFRKFFLWVTPIIAGAGALWKLYWSKL